MRKRELLIQDILRWAEVYRDKTGRWPTRSTPGPTGMLGLTWSAIDRALRVGGRGLPGGSSLARLLAEQKGARNRVSLPELTEEQIVRWAEAYQQQQGKWPTENSGLIPGSGGETWAAIDAALRQGSRGLPKGSSLPRLLAARCGLRNQKDLPPLDLATILGWIDAHKARTGKWPNYYCGAVVEAPGETWLGIHRRWCRVDGVCRAAPRWPGCWSSSAACGTS